MGHSPWSDYIILAIRPTAENNGSALHSFPRGKQSIPYIPIVSMNRTRLSARLECCNLMIISFSKVFTNSITTSLRLPPFVAYTKHLYNHLAMFKKLNALLLAVAAAIATVSAQTQEQMFLNDDDFYLPQYECDVTLPNGIHLLYLEEDEDLIPRSKPYDHSLEGTLWDSALNYMVLVKLQDDNTGRKFRGLARKTAEGNYQPLYGMVGPNYEYSVFFGHNESLRRMALPEKLEGSWYLDHIWNYLTDPNKKWEKEHPGQRLVYPVYGNLPARDALFDPQITQVYTLLKTSPAGSTTEFEVAGSIQAPVRQYDATTINRGGKKFGVSDDTGGFIIEFSASHNYPTKVNYDSENCDLTLTFGTRSLKKVSTHRGGQPIDHPDNDETTRWVLHRDWDRNPDRLFTIKQLNLWAQKSPIALWGTVKFYVDGVYDDWLAVRGQQAGTGLWFYTVWPREDYDTRTFDSNTRKLIVERLMKRKEK